MNILAIETSSSFLSVAARRSDGIWAEANLTGGFHHGEKLMLLIRQVLDMLRLKKQEVDSLACGLGPGSFTGLRIGLATVKGLAVSLHKKVIGVSSLDLIAEGSPVPSGRLAVVVDARREKVYAALYDCASGCPRKIVKDSLFSIDELMKKAGKDAIFSGDAVRTYGEEIRRHLGRKPVFLREEFWHPRASSIFSWLARAKPAIRPLSLQKLKPAYFRLSEAEERRQAAVVR